MTAARGQALYFSAILGLGIGVILLAVPAAAAVPFAALAIGAAAVLATEVVQVPGDDRSLDPVDAQPFSFASPAHLALVLALGAGPAALLAAFGVIVVDLLRGASRVAVVFNASVFAVATAGGGAAFALAGGTSGDVALPRDFPSYLALALVYVFLNLTLVNVMSALGSGRAPFAEVRDVLRTDFSSRSAEVGLGLVIGLFVLYRPWALIPCVPLVVAVYRAYERLALLRRETAHALETFANVVDERDPSTYLHSTRVAEDVAGLGRALGLPGAQVARLRWAGRLHDLGKISVDSAVLNKPGALNGAEFEAIRRHARLSARLLRRFRLASDEAHAVEYHHERYDGTGYYGIEAEKVPLAAFFLGVGDSFDAMTSDRSYRAGMSEEAALAEIERCAGTHFHPSVARAFVAYKRGEDPRTKMPRQDLRELRSVRGPLRAPSWTKGFSAATLVTLIGAVAGLLSLGLHATYSAAAGGVVVAIGLLWRRRDVNHARSFVLGVRRALDARTHPFAAVVTGLSVLERLDWVGLVRWDVETLSGRVTLQQGGLGAVRPTDVALSSWLGRDADAGELLIADGEQFGVPTTLVALPVRDEPVPLTWLVLSLRGDCPSWFGEALLEVRSDLADAFRARHPGSVSRLQPVAAAS